MKIILITLLLLSFNAFSSSTEYGDLFFPGKNPSLTTQEKQAIAIAKRWQAASEKGLAPSTGTDGSINYIYGSHQPSVLCAVLQVCDIQLQQGEKVNGLHLGDKARWTIEPAITGTSPFEIVHVIVKPHDVGLDTTLIVTTDRRTYNIRLRSHRTKFMPKVTFTYPEDALAKWDALKSTQRVTKQKKIIPQTGEYLGELNFEYNIEGNTSWKPVRVYNNGVKTIIQMPETMAQTEAPTLLVVRENDAMFSSDEEVLVNYRVQGDRYIVDTVFNKAILIVGVGRNQNKVTITRKEQ